MGVRAPIAPPWQVTWTARAARLGERLSQPPQTPSCGQLDQAPSSYRQFYGCSLQQPHCCRAIIPPCLDWRGQGCPAQVQTELQVEERNLGKLILKSFLDSVLNWIFWTFHIKIRAASLWQDCRHVPALLRMGEKGAAPQNAHSASSCHCWSQTRRWTPAGGSWGNRRAAEKSLLIIFLTSFSRCLVGEVGTTHQNSLKRPPRVSGSRLPEAEGDACSSNGLEHPAGTSILSILQNTLPGSAAFAGTQNRLPQAPSPGHGPLAVIFIQQLPAAASTKRQPRHRDHKPAWLCPWQWILSCLWQRLSGLARFFFFSSYRDISELNERGV